MTIVVEFVLLQRQSLKKNLTVKNKLHPLACFPEYATWAKNLPFLRLILGAIKDGKRKERNSNCCLIGQRWSLSCNPTVADPNFCVPSKQAERDLVAYKIVSQESVGCVWGRRQKEVGPSKISYPFVYVIIAPHMQSLSVASLLLHRPHTPRLHFQLSLAKDSALKRDN